jgi:hypothetical protein
MTATEMRRRAAGSGMRAAASRAEHEEKGVKGAVRSGMVGRALGTPGNGGTGEGRTTQKSWRGRMPDRAGARKGVREALSEVEVGGRGRAVRKRS